MKHAGPQALDAIEDVLAAVRRYAALRERSRGVFYAGPKAFLHFHEDEAGLFADLRTGGEWTRRRVVTELERRAFLRAVQAAVGLLPQRPRR